MSIRDFQKAVRQNGFYEFSHGNLNYEYLLAKAYDFINGWNIKKGKKLTREIADVLGLDSKHSSAIDAYYYGWLEMKDEERASWLWNEDIFNLFNDISPKGYYFSSHEGDGSLFGWFKEEME